MPKVSNKKIKSTYEEFMQAKTPSSKKKYEKEYKDFLLSEIIIASIEEDTIAVRKLAKLAGISPRNKVRLQKKVVSKY